MGATDSENTTLRLLTHRSSCRRFARREVGSEVLTEILDAGTKAASGGNLQPYSVIVIRNGQKKARLAELCLRQSFIADAPVVLLFCIDWHRIERWAAMQAAPDTTTASFRHFWISMQDVVICAQSVAIAADAVGLASVYVGAVLECLVELREMFALPDGVLPVVMLCVGYREGVVAPQSKHGSTFVVHEERYQDPSDRELAAAMEEKYNWTKSRSDEIERQIASVCRRVGGTGLAEQCGERIREQGFINAAQWYFGVRYPADRTARGNEQIVQTIRDFGFTWFDDFRFHDPTVDEP